jgi:nitrite reductase/ring-hydroxylating ferredoxin subunit
VAIKFLKRSLFQRLLGIPVTTKPLDPGCWTYSDGKVTIDLKRASELQKPGGAIRLEGANLPERLLVVFCEDGRYRAFHNRCTHVGHRRLDPVPGTNTVQCCSVSKSTYNFEGNKIYGPNPKPIRTYLTDTEGDRLIVTIIGPEESTAL